MLRDLWSVAGVVLLLAVGGLMVATFGRARAGDRRRPTRSVRAWIRRSRTPDPQPAPAVEAWIKPEQRTR